MNKYMLILALLVVPAAYGFKRDCQGLGGNNYTYSMNILSAQDGAAMCRVTLTSSEKDFIRQALASFSDSTKITRKFYLDTVKDKYGSNSNQDTATRRVARDFGGSKKDSNISRTVGDIRAMLNGKLKDIGTEQGAF